MNADERRKYKRFRPKQVTFVALGPLSNRLGNLLDIGPGGLRFEYVSETDNPGVTKIPVPDEKVDIFISQEKYYLIDVPCKLIYDTEIRRGFRFPLGLKYRNCGLRFGKLNARQYEKLKNYFTYFTSDNASH